MPAAQAARVVNGDRLPRQSDRAGIAAHRTGQHPDQRAFTGPNLTEERVDLAGIRREVDLVERDNAAECLAKANNL